MNNTAGTVWGVSGYRSRAGIIALLGGVFAIGSWWRVSQLGFFSDDWIFLSNTIYLPTTLVGYLGVNWYARPVYALIAYLLNLLANGSPAYWQVISSGIVLVSIVVACKLIDYTGRALGYSRRASWIGGVSGAVVLFFSPWMLAVYVWPTGVLTLWGFILFGVGYLVIEENKSVGTKCLGSVLVLCGFLSYEAYWFAFIPLLLISKEFRPSQIASFVRTTVWYVLPLGLAAIYQRVLVPLFAPGHVKAISASFPLIRHNIVQFSDFVAAAIAPVPMKALFLVLSAIVVVLLIVRAVSFAKMILVVVALGLGVIITAVIYGAAGYGLDGTGVMSRTMAAPGFYFAVLVGIMAAASIDQFGRKGNLSRATHAIPVLLSFVLVLLLVGFVARISEWVSIQEQSKRVLDSFMAVVDRSYLQNSQKDVSVVVEIDGDPNGRVFGAYWELGGAVAQTDPSLVPAANVWFLPARQGSWGTVWNGEAVVQRVCSDPSGSTVESRPSRVPPLYYRINPRNGAVLESGQLEKGKGFGCHGALPVFDKP